ncbi:MFS general substrate transporter [Gyrodon lividus]|nr:MFS general substrate transporter [Gyrodon lividus]
MSASAETRALLENARQRDGTQDVYSRFSHSQKCSILSVVSFSGLLMMFVWRSFIPSIPQVAHDLGSTEATVSIAVSVSIISSAIGALFWSSHSSVYGRRLIYLCGMPFLLIGSVGVATSSSIPSLFMWRSLQAFGCAARLALGCGVIGDIYCLEERGTALGIFSGVMLLANILAPAIGGVITKYASWRHLHSFIVVWGCLDFLILYSCLPETSHFSLIGRHVSRRLEWVNPFKCLSLLRNPNLFVVNITIAVTILTEFVLLVPLAYILDRQYGITSEAIIGACFLPRGIGSSVGSPVAGRLSDAVIKKWRRKRYGEWVPEDRLRIVYIGGLIIVPFSLIAFALTTTYAQGPLGLALSLLAMFTHGFGINFVINPINSYCVDVMTPQSAEVMAAGSALRALIGATGVLFLFPSVEYYGIITTNCIAASVVIIGYGLVHLTIKYGDRMRPPVDTGNMMVS